jgi:hypothetical protein
MCVLIFLGSEFENVFNFNILTQAVFELLILQLWCLYPRLFVAV